MKKIIIGIVLIPLSFAAPTIAALLFIQSLDHDIVFSAPGSQELVVEKPAKYYVWNHYGGSWEGKPYTQSETFPVGAKFLLKQNEPASDIPFVFVPVTSASSETHHSKKISLGYYELTQPGRYTLSVSGLDQPRFVSWSISPIDSMLWVVLGFLLATILMLAFLVSAIVLIIMGVVEQSKKSKGRSVSPAAA